MRKISEYFLDIYALLADIKRRPGLQKPVELAIYQYVPSEVYFFSEIFQDKQGICRQRDENLILRDLESIKKNVQTQWGIAIDAWQAGWDRAC